jgi:hypothetical protein
MAFGQRRRGGKLRVVGETVNSKRRNSGGAATDLMKNMNVSLQ